MKWTEIGHVVVGTIEVLTIIFGLFYLAYKFG